jgi:hypothetical protein
MNFEFTDEQKLFAESVKRFARENLAAGTLKRHVKHVPILIIFLAAKVDLVLELAI